MFSSFIPMASVKQNWREYILFSNSADDFGNMAQCTVEWRQCKYVGEGKPKRISSSI